ncbi:MULTISPECIES: MnhB domain-containing protein [Methanocalculus]|uniref:MnhB domain-containing protein n=1 Tax=Methanocalculus TaxID=71151 RepID=UPI00209E923A|nr:MnhB domain-containing protein [Methanocalculus sp. AMF5]MCP1661882.1 multicomponent Na+:H+ antiporter subunit B [Methanocalculus sp. AMF5]
MSSDIIVRTVSRLMVPFLLLFGAYVMLHGHAGAGGGFQAGSIITSALILAAIGMGINEVRRFAQRRRLWIIGSAGCLIFILTAVLALPAGGNIFEYGTIPLPYRPDAIHAIAITLVEIGIGLAVFSIVFLIILAIAGGEE